MSSGVRPCPFCLTKLDDAGGGLWRGLLARVGKRNALDLIAEHVGVKRQRSGFLLWESNGALRKRVLEEIRPALQQRKFTPAGLEVVR